MFFTRADWGAVPPKSSLTVVGPGDSLVVHHTGGGEPPESVDDAMAMLRGIQATHMAGEYSDIAYSMAVDQFGNLYECRGMGFMPGATYGHNSHTRAVVWLGGSDAGVAPSELALRAIADLYRAELGGALTGDATLSGHRDWVATACPGETLYGMLDTIRMFATGEPVAPVDPVTPVNPVTPVDPIFSNKGDEMLYVHEPVLRPVLFNGRSVYDMWVSQDGVSLGKTNVHCALVIMPVDPAVAADPAKPLFVDVYQNNGGRSSVETVKVEPAATIIPMKIGGRVGVVFDQARPVMVQCREVHYTN